MLKTTSRIYVAGHRGLVGSALVRQLKAKGFDHLILRTRAELDLTDQRAVEEFFEAQQPEYVFLAAAKVGGILANDRYPAEFIQQNLAIQTNVIHHAWRTGVRRLLFLGSSCIYPKDCPQPIKEEYLLTGLLEPTNRPYAIAKIAGVEMCWSYNRQYGTRFLAAMPTNLYGPGDNYDLQTSHVLPALIRKFHEARFGAVRTEALGVTGGGVSTSGDAASRLSPPASREASALTPRSLPAVMLWGTGRPRREFLYSDDLADGCIYLMTLPDTDFVALTGRRDAPPLINIGCGEDCTVAELAQRVAGVVGYRGAIGWDESKPDGTFRKMLDVGRMNALGWRARVPLVEGLRKAYDDFLRSSA